MELVLILKFEKFYLELELFNHACALAWLWWCHCGVLGLDFSGNHLWNFYYFILDSTHLVGVHSRINGLKQSTYIWLWMLSCAEAEEEHEWDGLIYVEGPLLALAQALVVLPRVIELAVQTDQRLSLSCCGLVEVVVNARIYRCLLEAGICCCKLLVVLVQTTHRILHRLLLLINYSWRRYLWCVSNYVFRCDHLLLLAWHDRVVYNWRLLQVATNLVGLMLHSLHLQWQLLMLMHLQLLLGYDWLHLQRLRNHHLDGLLL